MHKFWFVRPYLLAPLSKLHYIPTPRECFPGSYLFKIVNSSNSGCIVCFTLMRPSTSPDRSGGHPEQVIGVAPEGLTCYAAGCREDAQQHRSPVQSKCWLLMRRVGYLCKPEALVGSAAPSVPRCIHPDLPAHSAGSHIFPY